MLHHNTVISTEVQSLKTDGSNNNGLSFESNPFARQKQQRCTSNFLMPMGEYYVLFQNNMRFKLILKAQSLTILIYSLRQSLPTLLKLSYTKWMDQRRSQRRVAVLWMVVKIADCVLMCAFFGRENGCLQTRLCNTQCARREKGWELVEILPFGMTIMLICSLRMFQLTRQRLSCKQILRCRWLNKYIGAVAATWLHVHPKFGFRTMTELSD